MRPTPAAIRAARVWGVAPIGPTRKGVAALVEELRDAGEPESVARERARSMVDVIVSLIYSHDGPPAA